MAIKLLRYLLTTTSIILLTACAQLHNNLSDFEKIDPNISPAERLTQAQNALAAQDLSQAKYWLSMPDISTLSIQQRDQYLLLAAQVLLAEKQPQAALDRLEQISSTSDWSDAQYWHFHSTRAMAFAQLGRWQSSLAIRIVLDHSSTVSEQMTQQNREALWSTFMRMPLKQLEMLQATPVQMHASGWTELARIQRITQPPHQVAFQLRQWMQIYPSHPAQAYVREDLKKFISLTPSDTISRLGILLPQTGPLSEMAEAIQNGVLTAYYSGHASSSFTLKFYDTSAHSVSALHQMLRHDQIDAVIGPLSKSMLHKFQQLTLGIPVLALNYADHPSNASDGFFQFGLSAEDEARQIAQTAWKESRGPSVAALLPKNAWGKRIYAAFVAEWEKLGGQVAAVQFFHPKQKKIGHTIKKLLNLPISQQRIHLIKRILKAPVKGKARDRQDIDWVFLAAQPEKARQIKPLLDYYSRVRLPIYATSQIHSPIASKRDADLNGIRFCEIPWLIYPPKEHQLIQALWPKQQRRYSRLFALGIDAFHLIQQLNTEARTGTLTLRGETGLLTILPNGRIQRTLENVLFRRSRAVAY